MITAFVTAFVFTNLFVFKSAKRHVYIFLNNYAVKNQAYQKLTSIQLKKLILIALNWPRPIGGLKSLCIQI